MEPSSIKWSCAVILLKKKNALKLTFLLMILTISNVYVVINSCSISAEVESFFVVPPPLPVCFISACLYQYGSSGSRHKQLKRQH